MDQHPKAKNAFETRAVYYLIPPWSCPRCQRPLYYGDAVPTNLAKDDVWSAYTHADCPLVTRPPVRFTT